MSQSRLRFAPTPAQLFKLGKSHYRFARRQNNRDWRQKISRLYYGAYNISRAVRLCVNGEYSTESSDHKKVEAIPDDFPNKNTYSNRMAVLRDDRNLCDYDHAAVIGDLILAPGDALQLVGDFLQDAKVVPTATRSPDMRDALQTPDPDVKSAYSVSLKPEVGYLGWTTS